MREKKNPSSLDIGVLNSLISYEATKTAGTKINVVVIVNAAHFSDFANPIATRTSVMKSTVDRIAIIVTGIWFSRISESTLMYIYLYL